MADPRDLITEITEITVSVERTLFKGDGFPKAKLFQSAKGIVPRGIPPEAISSTLQSFITSELDKLEALTLTGTPKPPDSVSPPIQEDGKADPSAQKGEGIHPKAEENNQPPGVSRPQGASNEAKAASGDPTPICPTHRTPMRLGAGGKYFCPRKTGPGPKDYCKERA